MTTKTQLHCGACLTDYDDIPSLITHIEDCAAAGIMIILAYKSYDDFMGHPYSSYRYLLHRAVPIIKQYASAIAYELDNLNRTSIHAKLCDAVDIDYKSFKPFESEAIKTVPSFNEAEQIIWHELGKVILLKILKVYDNPD